MKTKSKKQKPNAVVLLEEKLAILSVQLLPSDMETIAKKAKTSARTVRRYTIDAEDVRDFNTGNKILIIGIQLVAQREQSLSAA